MTTKITAFLFIVYLIVLTWILLFKLGVQFSYMTTRSVNLIPFRELFLSNGKMGVSEIVSNVLIFVPPGIYAEFIFERWGFRKKLLFISLITFVVEGLQYVLAIGAFDSTDIVANTLGGTLGLMISKWLKKGYGNPYKAQKLINIVATIGTVIMIVLLVLLKMNRLPVRYQ